MPDRDLARKEFLESPIYRKLILSPDGQTTALMATMELDRKYLVELFLNDIRSPILRSDEPYEVPAPTDEGEGGEDSGVALDGLVLRSVRLCLLNKFEVGFEEEWVSKSTHEQHGEEEVVVQRLRSQQPPSALLSMLPLRPGENQVDVIVSKIKRRKGKGKKKKTGRRKLNTRYGKGKSRVGGKSKLGLKRSLSMNQRVQARLAQEAIKKSGADGPSMDMRTLIAQFETGSEIERLRNQLAKSKQSKNTSVEFIEEARRQWLQ